VPRATASAYTLGVEPPTMGFHGISVPEIASNAAAKGRGAVKSPPA
jgi:hypothetical protein